MRVLFVINRFAWGGAEKLVFELACALAERVDYVCVAALYRQNDLIEKEMISKLEQKSVDVIILDKEPGKKHVHCFKILYQFVRSHQISIIHGHCSVPMFFSKLAGFFTGTPVICTIHSTKGYSARQEMLTSWMVSEYVSIGQAAEQYMTEALKIKPGKITRIYNAIDVKKFESAKSNPEFWKAFGGKTGDYVLINVARVHEAKNQMCLLKAIKDCVDHGDQNIRLYILGDTFIFHELYDELAEYICSNGLEEYVCFLGMQTDVQNYLANSDVFVMTSIYEGLSVAFLEAVICGLPIITTELGFVKELNELAPCADVVPQNDWGAISNLIQTRKAKAQYPETVKLFKTTFSMGRYVKSHEELYQRFKR